MYIPNETRYEIMNYRRCGKSGLKLPEISLGLWHNFGDITPFKTQQSLLRTAFDNGITHFDLANNYGPPIGEAERNFGIHMKYDWNHYRDELVISTKAGFDMWEGPYGTRNGSRKYLVASLEQSLKRMNLDYVDIFYHHTPDPETPLEETMSALDRIVRDGKALYVGISNYKLEEAKTAIKILQQLGTPMLIHQPNYSMFNRYIELGLSDMLYDEGVGCIAYGPFAGGILTNKYLEGVPNNSRAAKDPRFLTIKDITEERLNKVRELSNIAIERGQSLAQMVLQWVLRTNQVTSALIGASSPEQIIENVQATKCAALTDIELSRIDDILKM